MSKITDIAENLGNEIQKLPEYESYIKAVNKYEDDEEAQNLLTKVRRLENEIIAAHEDEESHEENEKLYKEYEEISLELSEIPVVEEYYDAVEALEKELSEINDEISEELYLDFAHVVE